MNQGDIIVINFPFTDLSQSKIRPALVISNSRYNSKNNIIVAAISTQPGLQEFSLPIGAQDISSGILNKKSYIRLQNIFTLEKRLIIKKVATVQVPFQKKITEKMISFLE